jgi:hypothetical protein
LDLFQVLIDVYAREAFAALLGVYINVKKIGRNFQQVQALVTLSKDFIVVNYFGHFWPLLGKIKN